jgi:hypothetical protein
VLAGAVLLAPAAARAQAGDADVQRIRQRLDVPSPLRDSVESARPTFRISVTEARIDIQPFWGELDAVSPWVRPSGGAWHHEFTNMATPDAFKGYGGIFTNGEKAGLAVQGMLSALAFEYLPGAIAEAVRQTRERAAKREVQAALEDFYVTHPGTRPAPTAERLP